MTGSAIKGPGIFLAQFAGNDAPFDSLPAPGHAIEIAPGRQEIRLANLTQKRPETVLLVKQVMAQSPQLVVAP